MKREKKQVSACLLRLTQDIKHAARLEPTGGNYFVFCLCEPRTLCPGQEHLVQNDFKPSKDLCDILNNRRSDQ